MIHQYIWWIRSIFLAIHRVSFFDDSAFLHGSETFTHSSCRTLPFYAHFSSQRSRLNTISNIHQHYCSYPDGLQQSRRISFWSSSLLNGFYFATRLCWHCCMIDSHHLLGFVQMRILAWVQRRFAKVTIFFVNRCDPDYKINPPTFDHWHTLKPVVDPHSSFDSKSPGMYISSVGFGKAVTCSSPEL